MVSTIQTKPTHTPDCVSDDSSEQIYDDLPDGLIDRRQQKVRYSGENAWNWVHRGKLPRRGRLKAKAAGGGYIVTEESAIRIAGTTRGSVAVS